MTRARGRHGRTRRRPKIGAVGGVIDTLSELGATSLAPYMAVLAGLSFVSGLAQAGLLVLISEVAVSIVQSNRPLRFHGLIIGRDEAILIAAMLVLIFGALSLVFAWLSSRLSGKALELSRQRVLGAFFGASWSLQSQERLGHLQQLVTVNCTRVGNILLAITSGVQSALTVLALLAAAFFVDPLAAAVVLAFGLLLSFALRPFGRWSRKASRELAEKTQTLGTLVTEYTRLVREFRLFGVERTAVSELLENNSDAAATFGRTKQLVQTGPVIYQSLALGFVVVALFVLTGTGVAKDLGSVGAVLLLILRCLTYGSNIQSISQQVRTYEAFLDVVKEDLRYYEAVPSVTGGEAMPQNLDVWFNGVSYAYDGVNLVLRDITFRLPGGSILGVVGRSGSGKTTLTQLLLGLRTPSNGSVLIGTVMVDELEKEGGKSPVGIVPQEPVLLQGSIAANIAFFRQIPRETIEMASRAAHLDADVRGMPLGYESRVGEGGGALSGGQKQRLAIARALVGWPKLLVLDEPTSALDGYSEVVVRQTLSELRGQMTIVVISHRFATVEDCDYILVLEHGRISDFGPRDTVVKGLAFQTVASGELRQ